MATDSRFCPGCGTEHAPGAKFCASCGYALTPDAAQTQRTTSGTQGEKSLWNSVLTKANHIAGGDEEIVDLHLSDLVTSVFKKHTKEEQNEVFICGTDKTTPAEHEIAETWPKPWLYFRVFLALAGTLFVLTLLWTGFQNSNALPGIMFVGALTVPFTVLVFFFEVNAPRNITIMETTKVFFLGGALSFLATLALFEFSPQSSLHTSDGALTYFGATVVGIVEEVGKLLIVAWFCRDTKVKYILNGLLIGSAVGAGFAVFETAGYIFRFGTTWDALLEVLFLRAVLAPGGHVVWAAISGAALVAVKKDQPFEWGFMAKPAFLKLFLVPVVLHAIWDMPIPPLGNIYWHHYAMIFAAWVFVLLLVNKGLKQISNLKRQAQVAEHDAPEAAAAAE